MNIYNRVAGLQTKIKNVMSADFLVDTSKTLLRVNKTQMVGLYPTLTAAKEVLDGLLIKCGSNDPSEREATLNQTVTYLKPFTVQNSQSGATLGTMFSALSNGGTVTAGSGLYTIAISVADTANSRARIINENDAYGSFAADVWDSQSYSKSLYSTRARVVGFDTTKWNQNICVLGFHGAHYIPTFTAGLTLEKGCLFRPNSQGKWRCSWYLQPQLEDSTTLYREQAFYDTNYSITDILDFSILIEDYGRVAVWMIGGKPIFSVKAEDFKLTSEGSGQLITNVVYSESTGNTFAYVGAEVRRRATGTAQYSIDIYRSSLEVQT